MLDGDKTTSGAGATSDATSGGATSDGDGRQHQPWRRQYSGTAAPRRYERVVGARGVAAGNAGCTAERPQRAAWSPPGGRQCAGRDPCVGPKLVHMF